MKKVTLFLTAIGFLYVANAAETYELKKSTSQSVIKLDVPKDGQILVKQFPNCGAMVLMDSKNKKMTSGTAYRPIEVAVKKGNYKLAVIPMMNDCTITVAMPE